MLANDIRNYRRMDDYIAHHGILGQKWGVRRFQDKSGRLTAEGKKRYSIDKDGISTKEQIREKKGLVKTIEAPSSDQLYKRNIFGKEVFSDAGKKFKSDVEDLTKEYFDKNKVELDDYKELYKKSNQLLSKYHHQIKDEPRISEEERKELHKLEEEEFQKYLELVKNIRSNINNLDKDSRNTASLIIEKSIEENIWAPILDEEQKRIEKLNNISHSDLVDEVYSAIWDEDYISHHGILGQKWGKKNGPPYPLAAGSHSSSEKKAASAAGVKVGKSSGRGSSEGLNITQSGQKEKPGLIGSMIEGAKNAKLNKQRKQALEKAREAKAKKAEEKAAAEAHEAERQKALNSGDYKEIQKYANESSYEELQRAMNKANAMQQLNQKVVDSEPVEPSIMDQIDKAADMVGRATNAATKGIGAWNKFAEVYNTFADPDSMLPEIGKNWSEEKEKRIKAKEKEAKEAEEKVRKERVEEITKKLDPKLVMKNQKLFTKDELQEANNRLVTYSQLKEKADAIDKEAADAKAKKLADKQKRQAEKDEAKAKKEFEAQQAKERAKNNYLEDIENRQYNFGDDDSGFKASNPTFKKAVKEAYDYFDNDSIWGSTSMSSLKSSNTETTKKAQEVTSSIFSYLNSDKKYNAPVTVNNWQSMYQSSIYDYE